MLANMRSQYWTHVRIEAEGYLVTVKQNFVLCGQAGRSAVRVIGSRLHLAHEGSEVLSHAAQKFSSGEIIRPMREQQVSQCAYEWTHVWDGIVFFLLRENNTRSVRSEKNVKPVSVQLSKIMLLLRHENNKRQ